MARKFNLKSFIIATLRRASYRYPARSEALKRARIDRGIYQCNICKEGFKRESVVIDHIVPVVDVKTGFTNWDDYINRMFPPVEGLQLLCEYCHDSKTNIEKNLRKKHRKKLTKKSE